MAEKTVRHASISAWRPTAGSFRRFLVFLDNGVESNGESYLEMQRRLVGYFARKGCTAPEELADETLNRVSRRLDEKGSITIDSPAHYCYITARYVFLERLRAIPEVPLDDMNLRVAGNAQMRAPDTDELERKEKMLECLDECMSKLDERNRALILGYYFGNQGAKLRNRSSMAEKLGISVNALSIRACRIRRTLHSCVGKCASDDLK